MERSLWPLDQMGDAVGFEIEQIPVRIRPAPSRKGDRKWVKPK